MASVNIKGLDSLQKHLKRIQDMDLTDAVTKATIYVHGQAKEFAVFDGGYSTGHLRESINRSVSKKKTEIVGKVYTNVEYAKYVEFGTGQRGNGSYPYAEELEFPLVYKSDWAGMVAEPFMYPAVKSGRSYVKSVLSSEIKLKMK